MFKVVLITVTLYGIVTYAEISVLNGIRCLSSVTQTGKRMNETYHKPAEANDVWRCVLTCRDDTDCQSINFNMKTKHCHFMTTNHFAMPHLLVSDPDFVYGPNARHPCTRQPYCYLRNAASKKITQQSSSLNDVAHAGRAVDGNTDGDYHHYSCTHTQRDQDNPWWRVDMSSPHLVKSVKIFNRNDCCGERLDDFEIRVGNSLEDNGNKNTRCGDLHSLRTETVKTINCDPPLLGRYLNIRIPGSPYALTLCEVIVNP